MRYFRCQKIIEGSIIRGLDTSYNLLSDMRLFEAATSNSIFELLVRHSVFRQARAKRGIKSPAEEYSGTTDGLILDFGEDAIFEVFLKGRFFAKKSKFLILPLLVLASRKIDSDCLSSQEKR